MPTIASGKFAVLGGASQIGSHIGAELLARGAREVVLFDNLSLGSLEPLNDLLADERCRFVRGDVLRPDDLFDALGEVDGVFAVAGMMASTIDAHPGISIEVNVTGFHNALEACRYRNVGKVVFSSSGGVYGIPGDDDMDEATPFRWQGSPPASTIYGAAKILCEGLARLYQERHGIDFVALRYPSVYGERQHGRAVMGGHIAQSCERICQNLPPIIDGDGNHVQDYVYVGDVARANVLAMESVVTGESINIVSGTATSQERIVELVTKACGSELRPEYRPMIVTRWPPRTHLHFTRDKAKELIGWEPEVSIEEGVSRVARWVEQRRHSS